MADPFDVLREAYERVLRAKQNEQPTVQPIWDAINAIPAVLEAATSRATNAGLSDTQLRYRLLGHAASLRAEEWDEENAAAADVEEAASRLVATP